MAVRRSGDQASAGQVDPFAADDRRARRHQHRAVVAGRADLVLAVGGDQLAFGEGLEADQRPREAEFRRLDDPGLQQLEALPAAAGCRLRAARSGRSAPGSPAPPRSPGRRGLLEVLAAFGHHRHAVVVGRAMRGRAGSAACPLPRPCGITRCTAGSPMASAAAALRSNAG
jgi:hypothetical protein